MPPLPLSGRYSLWPFFIVRLGFPIAAAQPISDLGYGDDGLAMGLDWRPVALLDVTLSRKLSARDFSNS